MVKATRKRRKNSSNDSSAGSKSDNGKSTVTRAPEGFTLSTGHVVSRRIVAAIDGHEKQGKTAFALTAPGPICFFNFDLGLEGVVEKFENEKEIFRTDFDMECPPKSDKQEYYDGIWEEFVQRFRVALDHPDIRSIVIDTETESWETIRLAYFGKKDQVMPHHYGPVNEEYMTLLKRVYKTDKNLILLRKMRPKYINDAWCGEYEPAGFSKLNYVVQLIAGVEFDNEEKEFYLNVRDSRLNKENVLGLNFRGDKCDFAELAAFVFEGDADDWR